MFNFDKPDTNREKFDEIGQKIWQLHLDLVKLKSQIDNQIVTLDECHVHLGFSNKVAGNFGTVLKKKEVKSKPVNFSYASGKSLNHLIHEEQSITGKVKNKV
ncbi:hypothetical protein Metev_1789 [Methanohalobium evestigatum Z-7303]|uniref:Uncharacterized protein n=1 Tax=Methanohalobium evestigatum (strain ATCC BAA-1072 / DSM 3721 / NBRC 107634 / OCM 161 / Z-7303) TaxID=644295 RepID=D7EBA8_METEZ|nr:hypothetical protein [Methanohalobium evestigatum]ADI74625.1 hypothetical protein Metev_1789 [Methanohalobium evestigatum Z-7303]